MKREREEVAKRKGRGCKEKGKKGILKRGVEEDTSIITASLFNAAFEHKLSHHWDKTFGPLAIALKEEFFHKTFFSSK